LTVDMPQWRQEIEQVGVFLENYGDRVPAELIEQQDRIKAALG